MVSGKVLNERISGHGPFPPFFEVSTRESRVSVGLNFFWTWWFPVYRRSPEEKKAMFFDSKK
jgi:hypothetical protein